MIREYSLDELCINLLITSTCNASCSFCIANDYMRLHNTSLYIQKEQFNKFLSYVEKEKNSIEQVNLLGGEPSLHQDALYFARELYQIGISVGFSTNGLWNEKFRKTFEKIDFPIEFEITYLGKDYYSPINYKKIKRTFDQLKGLEVSLGIIITSEQTDYKEHLDICEKYGFDLRWALLEPTIKIGLPSHYLSKKNLESVGRLVENMIKEANERDIYTWADLTVPMCMFNQKQLSLFEKERNDIQFFCPPFFDIDTDLKIWRCLPLAERNPKKLTQFTSLKEAYLFLNKVRENYKSIGVFDDCSSCEFLGRKCSGGPTIAKIIKNEIRF